jgi:hypothetical protein
MTSRRFESIGGILNRTATDPTPTDEPDDTTPTAALDTAPAAVTKLRHTGQHPRRTGGAATQQPSRKASASSDGGVRRIAFRLDPALHSALTARVASEKTSQGQIVLDGIEAAHQAEVLTGLVTAEAAGWQTGSLFPRIKTRGTAQATVPVEIRLHAQAVTVLDQLVTDRRRLPHPAHRRRPPPPPPLTDPLGQS